MLPVLADVGALQLRHRAGALEVDRKADASPVTLADSESEELIEQALARLCPAIPVVGEERVSAGAMPPAADRFFLVDPLDGTREFIAGRDEFTVNIGLVETGRPVFGMVYAPARAELFVAPYRGRAIRLELAPGDRSASLDAGMAITARRPGAAGLVAVASRSHSDAATEEILARHPVCERVSAGSSLKFCLIAHGKADFYPRPGRTMEWDTCAGHAVLEVAGGRVTTLDGLAFAYGKREQGFANPGFLAWGRTAT
ncbi:MAG: 3'(2'),5'-bisphosphate nucleotidase CysQ [Rhizobiales bacterium]|nr:3'(2'),5'-bisphosphate nucleotidase CysQ [Hyphomicrobiales bacterium]